MDRVHGFTLIELVITVLLIAIIAVLAAPSFQKMIKTYHLESSTRHLVTLLSQARSDATIQRQVITIYLNQSGTNTSSSKYWKSSGKTQLNGSVQKIEFSPRGQVLNQTQSLSLQLCDDQAALSQQARIISLSRFGLVESVTKGACV